MSTVPDPYRVVLLDGGPVSLWTPVRVARVLSSCASLAEALYGASVARDALASDRVRRCRVAVVDEAGDLVYADFHAIKHSKLREVFCGN